MHLAAHTEMGPVELPHPSPTPCGDACCLCDMRQTSHGVWLTLTCTNITVNESLSPQKVSEAVFLLIAESS